MRAPRWVLAGLVLFAAVGFILYRFQPVPAPKPAVATITPAPLPLTASIDEPPPDLILDLFAPTPARLDAQQRGAAITQRIEEVLAVTFLLSRCGFMSDAEYQATYQALVQYAYSAELAPSLEAAVIAVRPIADSAAASYRMVYGRVPCTDPSLPPIIDQLSAWRTQSARMVRDSSSNP